MLLSHNPNYKNVVMLKNVYKMFTYRQGSHISDTVVSTHGLNCLNVCAGFSFFLEKK